MTKKNFFGGSSFWSMEPAFAALEGVDKVVPGYMCGEDPHPTRATVATGTTGHIEVVKVQYRPEKIDIKLLLAAFVKLHDPTEKPTTGRAGRQFSSFVGCTTNGQKRAARSWLATIKRRYDEPLCTQVKSTDGDKFWAAEAGDIQYYYNNGHSDLYCIEEVRPVLRSFTRDFWEHLYIPEEKKYDNPLLTTMMVV